MPKIAKPYQLESKAALLNGTSMLADQAGLGKTYTTLLTIEEYGSPLPTLMIGTSISLGVWKREYLEMDPGAFVLMLTAKNVDEVAGPYDLVVVSMDLVGRTKKVAAALRSRRWGVMGIDECHNMSGHESLRTQAALVGDDPIGAYADKIVLLTGTPTRTHAGNLWPLVKGTQPERLKGRSYTEFTERFCTHKMRQFKTRNGGVREERVIKGTNMKRVEELKRDLDGWWIRHLKKDVLQELDEKIHSVIPVEVHELKAVEQLAASEEGQLLQEVLNTRDFRAMEDMDAQMSRLQRLLGMIKAEAGAKYAIEKIGEDEKDCALVWYRHREVGDILQRVMEKAGLFVPRIDGSTPQSKRTDIEEAFQRGTKPTAALLQIKAAGESLTLTRATRNIFVEASWVPSENSQASDRLHRLNQTRGVLCDYLAVAGSVDEMLLEIVRRRTEEAEALEAGALVKRKTK